MDEISRQRFRLMAEVLAAAGHEIRLSIIHFLGDGEQCVCDIAAHVGAKRSNVSRHLSVLLQAGILRQRREGLKVIYSLRTPCILSITGCVGGVLRKRADDAGAAAGLFPPGETAAKAPPRRNNRAPAGRKRT